MAVCLFPRLDCAPREGRGHVGLAQHLAGAQGDGCQDGGLRKQGKLEMAVEGTGDGAASSREDGQVPHELPGVWPSSTPHVQSEGDRPLVLSDRVRGRQAGTRDRAWAHGQGAAPAVWTGGNL